MERKLTIVLLFLLTLSVVGLLSQAGVTRFERVHIGASFQDPGAGALSLDAGVTANSVGIIGSDGRIPALSSTFLADLSGANLTGLSIPDLTGAENVTGIWDFQTAPTMTATAGAAPDINSVFRDSIPRAWASVQNNGAVSLLDDYNVSSVTRAGVGNVTVFWDTDLADATYAVTITVGGSQGVCDFISKAVGSINVLCRISSTLVAVDTDFDIVVIGE